eukprot:4771140-Pleurochrysis_carterae.AAC.1
MYEATWLKTAVICDLVHSSRWPEFCSVLRGEHSQIAKTFKTISRTSNLFETSADKLICIIEAERPAQLCMPIHPPH